MTLVIRDLQLDLLAERRLEHALASHFFEHSAPHCAWLGPDRVGEVVRLGIAKARRYGHFSQREACIFLSVMFMVGSHFDVDPQLAWVAKHLASPPGSDPRRRAAMLLQDAMYFIDDVAGENNERLVRALVRLRNADRTLGDRFRADQREAGIVQALAVLYPEKARVIGDGRLRAVAREGIAGADKYQLVAGNGALVYASHALLLGSGFDADPLYPWGRTTLNAHELSPEARTNALRDQGLAFLDDVGLRGRDRAALVATDN